MTSRWFPLLEILGLTAIAIELFSLDRNLYRFRFFLSLGCLIYVLVVSRYSGISRKELGITSLRNLFTAFKPLLLPTALSAGSIMLFCNVWPHFLAFDLLSPKIVTQKTYRILSYVLIAVPVQEVIFRGYVISRLESISKNRLFLVLSSAVIYAAVHLPFGSVLMTTGSFLLGLLLAHNFVTYRNIYPLVLVHSILGGFTVYYLIG